jgi:sugar phosphate isomerase/epimerase
MVPTDRWLTEDGVKDVADRINGMAEVAAQFGLTVGYHNHAQEFLASFDGQTAYERFIALTEDRVAIELDLFWALVGGQEPAALTASLGDRLIALHIKDGVAPASNPFAPGAPAFSSTSLDQRHAGDGDVPLVESLQAATALQYAVIEYDHAPGDVFDDIASSYAFLIDGGYAR